MKTLLAIIASIFPLCAVEVVSAIPVRAQDCDSAISDVLLDIADRGAIIEKTWKNDASEYSGNPFPGSEHFVIALSGSGDGAMNPKRAAKVANDIMMSGKLNQAWATAIMVACPSLSVVGFGMYRTGWQNAFYRFQDGRVRPKVCVSDMDRQPTWGVGWCD